MAELTYDKALAMVTEMAAAVSDADLQTKLVEAWNAAAGDKKKQAAARSELLLPVQTKVIAKYGFEPNQKGMMMSTREFDPWNHIPEIHEKNGVVTYNITPDIRKDQPSLEAFLVEWRKTPPKPSANAKEKPFTLENAKALQNDLIAGYSSAEYQEALKKVYAEVAGDAKKLNPAKGKLALEMVQSKVFPKYGFEGSQKGVVQSMQAFGPHNNDPAVGRNNIIMTYYMDADAQKVSLEEYVEATIKAMASPKAAASTKAAATPKATATPKAATPKAKSTPSTVSRASTQMLKARMRAKGNTKTGLQRIDADGQTAGWAPTEFIDDVVAIYEHGKKETEDGNFAEGEPFLRDALLFFEEVVGEGHVYTLLCGNSLGFNLHEQGRFAEGEPILKNAVAGFTKLYGKNHEKTIAAMNNYALCLQGTNQMDKAADVLRELLAISEKVSGPVNGGIDPVSGQKMNNGVGAHATMAIASNLAECLRLSGQLEEAQNYFWACYNGQAQLDSPESPTCVMFANNLAVCLRDQGKNELARYFYKRAYEGMVKYYGKNHPKVKLVQQNMQELEKDANASGPAELPYFLRTEARKPQDVHHANEPFLNKPMTNFSTKGMRAFGSRMVHIQTAIVLNA